VLVLSEVVVVVVVSLDVLASQYSVPAVQVPVAWAEIFWLYTPAINIIANAILDRCKCCKNMIMYSLGKLIYG
jgi:hypothetical protein